MLVWKIHESKYELTKSNELVIKEPLYISTLSDYAILAFVKISVKLNREPAVLAYRKHEKLNLRMNNYKVKLGFGLHLGWGIEGAIGSEFKIDASYLSPNVNMASRLEGATKQYGTSILISSELHQQTTDKMQ